MTASRISAAAAALTAIVLAAVLSATSPASATASFTCTIDDASIAFDMLANIGSGDVGAMQLTQGALKIKSPKIGAVTGKTGAEVEVKGENLVQIWIRGRELRLGFSLDDAFPDAAVSLVIVGSRLRESVYGGRYELKIARDGKTQSFSGRIKDCTGD
jgi:hypothetical protein